MSDFVPVSRERHADRHWRRSTRFDFAREVVVAPFAAAETARIALAYPLTFLKENDAFVPVALLSLDGQKNLFVAPDGRWLGGYLPALLRGHPFALLPSTDDNLVLCIDEASGLTQGAETGTPFFEDDGTIAAPTRSVLDFLTNLEKNRFAARQVLTRLNALGLVMPWDITVTSPTGPQKVVGLHRIDEAALNALPAADFAGLRADGAIGMAYGQILSTQNLDTLVRLSEVHAAHDAADRTLLQQAFTGPDTSDLDIDWGMFADTPGDDATCASAGHDAAPPPDRTNRD